MSLKIEEGDGKMSYFEMLEEGARYALVRALVSEKNRPALLAWRAASGVEKKALEKAAIREEENILVDSQISAGLIQEHDKNITFKDGQESFWYALRVDFFRVYYDIKKEFQNNELGYADVHKILRRHRFTATKEPHKGDIVVWFKDSKVKTVEHIGRYVAYANGTHFVRSKFGREMKVYIHPVELVDVKYGDYYMFYTHSSCAADGDQPKEPIISIAQNFSTTPTVFIPPTSNNNTASTTDTNEKKKKKKKKKKPSTVQGSETKHGDGDDDDNRDNLNQNPSPASNVGSKSNDDNSANGTKTQNKETTSDTNANVVVGLDQTNANDKNQEAADAQKKQKKKKNKQK